MVAIHAGLRIASSAESPSRISGRACGHRPPRHGSQAAFDPALHGGEAMATAPVGIEAR